MLTLLHALALTVWTPAAPDRACAQQPEPSATNAAVEARWAAAWDAPDAPSGPDAGNE